jgi:hypothetical protein
LTLLLLCIVVVIVTNLAVSVLREEPFEPALPAYSGLMADVSNGDTLTLQGIAKMIIMANDGAWDSKGSVLDIAKSAGEWALMVCVLRANQATTDISVADLDRMYSQADSTQVLAGSRRATAFAWVRVTAQITAAIAAEKGQSKLTVAGALHAVFGGINAEGSEALCPCMTCNPRIWVGITAGSSTAATGHNAD